MKSGLAVLRSVGLFAIGVLALLALSSFILGIGPASAARADLIETVRNETPQAKVEAFLRATAAGDEAAALAAWEYPDWLARQDRGPALGERRAAVTRNLTELRLGGRVFERGIEWWRSCCEPGVIENSREAGFARIHVTLSREEDSRGWFYFFDVVTRGGAYWGGAMDYPPREWAIVDVYPMSEKPIFWVHSR